jgi:hypothetical protein
MLSYSIIAPVALSQKSFEARILHLWVTTRIPFTRANLQVLTGVGRKRLDRWLDELCAAGVLDVDVSDAGDMTWSVRGAERPRSGAETVGEHSRMERLTAEVAPAKSTALALAGKLGGLRAPSEGGKSLVASGVLSFFFGPAGWLYAAPLKTAGPATLVYLILCMLLPKFLLLPLLGVTAPISALIGLGYAWRHNQHGERTPLLGPKKP